MATIDKLATPFLFVVLGVAFALATWDLVHAFRGLPNKEIARRLAIALVSTVGFALFVSLLIVWGTAHWSH